MATRSRHRAHRSRFAAALLAGVVAACAGDPGEPAPEPEPAPAGLEYPFNPASYRVGEAVTPNTPTCGGGAVLGYSVAPALPAGLGLDASTGAITGTPTAVAATATYTVTAANATGSTSADLSITVDRLNEIAVSPADATIPLGLSRRYTATALFELAGPNDATELATWSSSDGAVASVAAGVVRSLAEGTTTISATFGGVTGTTQLTVGPVSFVSLVIPDGDVIDIPADGRTLQLHLSAVYSDGSTVDVTELATWSVEVGFVAVSNTPGTKGLVSTVELGDDAVRAVWQGATARIAITVY